MTYWGKMCVVTEVTSNISHFYGWFCKALGIRPLKSQGNLRRCSNASLWLIPRGQQLKSSEEMGWRCNLGPPIPPQDGETPPDSRGGGQFPTCSTNGKQTLFLIKAGKAATPPTLPTKPSPWNKWHPAIPGNWAAHLPLAISSRIVN